MELILENYNLIITNEAQSDIDQYLYTINYIFDAPITAKKHYDGLYDLFRKIRKYPTANPIRHDIFLPQYGLNLRRANYKKMAILYTINENTVYVHRVVAASVITAEL